MKVRWASLAQRDLIVIADWISVESASSSAKAGAHIRDAASKRAARPLIGVAGL